MKPAPRVKTVKRPWGSFDLLALNQKCSVKIISMKPRQALSLQSHRKRDEFWVILEGSGRMEVGKRKFRVSKGKRVFIPRGRRHRLWAGGQPVRFLEVAFGAFDEHDEKRFADLYGRK